VRSRYSTLGDVAWLAEVLPGLRELRLEQCTGALSQPLSLPLLERLTLEAPLLDGSTLPALVGSSWPRLTELRLLVSSWPGVAVAPAEVAQLLQGAQAPRLRRLAVRGLDGCDALCESLVDSPLAGQLEVLELAGTLTDEGARALAGGADRLASLRLLDVRANRLGDGGLALLRGMGAVVWGFGNSPPAQAPAWKASEGLPSARRGGPGLF